MPESIKHGFTEAEKRQAIVRTHKSNNVLHQKVNYWNVLRALMSVKNILMCE